MVSENIEPGIERRITVRLVAYWERLRGERDMPQENDIDPEDLGDLWENCFLIQVRDLSQSDYNFTYLGSAIVDAYRGSLSETDLEENALVSPTANRLSHSYKQVIKSRQPVLEEGKFLNLHNDLVKYRQCLLPLGKDGHVEAIFGGMRFKVYRQ